MARENEAETKVLITAGIAAMVEGLPHDLTATSIQRLTDFILAQHRNLSLQEFRLIGDRLLRKKIFGKLNLNTIATEIDSYWAERLEFAENYTIQKASEQKGQIAHLNILEAYDRIAEDVKKKREKEKEVEKEKEAETRKVNSEKVNELKKEYGKDFKP